MFVCLFTSSDGYGRFAGIMVQCGTLKRLPKLRVGLEFGLFGCQGFFETSIFGSSCSSYTFSFGVAETFLRFKNVRV